MYHIGVATQHPPLPDPDHLSALGIDFIKQCLTIDAMQRPTATELMVHPWMLDLREQLKQYEEEEQRQLDEEEPTYGEGAIALKAHMLEAKEEASIAPSPDITPGIEGTPLLTPTET